MASQPTATDDDEGKHVRNANGEDIGIVTEVKGTKLYVDPDPSLTEQLRTKLDWNDETEDSYPVSQEFVAEITDDEIRLRPL